MIFVAEMFLLRFFVSIFLPFTPKCFCIPWATFYLTFVLFLDDVLMIFCIVWATSYLICQT